jgi:hypothetical protein
VNVLDEQILPSQHQDEVLTLGQAARLAGLPLGDFIDLCGKLHVPMLWAPKGGIAAEVDALDSLLRDSRGGE